ncbi:biotin-dependent carboxyltransferase family protein [Agromyces sp. Marseille-Q5079]|uniref:5-oxoprolinase subunit C family protein n=1 Tax=Agromyces sp. Marseille-Q5079 TaxID=3439059 RepID=UPI003D9CA440
MTGGPGPLGPGTLTIERPGAQTLVEDLGRPGLAHLGVPASGALDRGALALANRLVGNPDHAAALEIVMGGFRARVDAETWFAVTGAWGDVRLDGRRIAPYTAARATAGAVLELGTPDRGIRYLLAFRGGLEVPPVLGSRSRDTLSGIGPEPLRAGDVLPIGAEPAASVPLLDREAAFPPPAGAVTLALLPGPRADRFTDAAHRTLYERPWRMSEQADRIGARLTGDALERLIPGELPSEATVPGSMQVAGDGRPTILLADRPVTGGYPVIAVVSAASLDRLAQVRPGQEVRFRHA